jgi:hypothetical protein
VPGQLGFAATEGGEHGEGEQFPGGHVDAAAGEVVAEAVGGQEPLDVLLVGGRVGIERVDPVGADDLLLPARPCSYRVCGVVVDWPGSGSSTPRSVSTSLVACRKSNTRAMPTYGTAW